MSVKRYVHLHLPTLETKMLMSVLWRWGQVRGWFSPLMTLSQRKRPCEVNNSSHIEVFVSENDLQGLDKTWTLWIGTISLLKCFLPFTYSFQPSLNRFKLLTLYSKNCPQWFEHDTFLMCVHIILTMCVYMWYILLTNVFFF